MKTECPLQIFEKHSYIKFQENRQIEGELFHADGQKGRQRDKHEEADSGLW